MAGSNPDWGMEHDSPGTLSFAMIGRFITERTLSIAITAVKSQRPKEFAPRRPHPVKKRLLSVEPVVRLEDSRLS
jgi:hypothetical protein